MAKLPKATPRPPLSPAMQEIMRRIQAGELKIADPTTGHTTPYTVDQKANSATTMSPYNIPADLSIPDFLRRYLPGEGPGPDYTYPPRWAPGIKPPGTGLIPTSNMPYVRPPGTGLIPTSNIPTGAPSTGGALVPTGGNLPAAAGETALDGGEGALYRLLHNVWPKMLGGSAPLQLTGPAAAGAGGLGSMALRALMGIPGMAATFAMHSTPANQGEQPLYRVDPATGRLAPNPAAAASMPSPANLPPPTPLPQPRPAAAPGFTGPVPMPQANPLRMSPSNDLNQIGPGVPQGQTAGPSLIQQFLAALQNNQPGPFAGGPSSPNYGTGGY